MPMEWRLQAYVWYPLRLIYRVFLFGELLESGEGGGGGGGGNLEGLVSLRHSDSSVAPQGVKGTDTSKIISLLLFFSRAVLVNI